MEQERSSTQYMRDFMQEDAHRIINFKKLEEENDHETSVQGNRIKVRMLYRSSGNISGRSEIRFLSGI